MLLADALRDWGLPAVFLGGFIEGEAAGFAGGLLAHRGFLSLPGAALAVGAGGFAGDQAAFWAGRLLARRPAVQRWLARPAAQRIADRVAAHPALWAFLMRWLYGLRSVTAASLGASGARPGVVMAMDAASAVIWGFTVTALGYGIARSLALRLEGLALHHHLVLMIAAGLALAWAVGHLGRRLLRGRDGEGGE